MQFRGKLVTLKELSPDYFDEYIKMFSPRVKQLLHVSSNACERDYLKHCLVEHEARRQFFFCIFDNQENKLIGAVTLRSPQDTLGQVGSWINEQYWGGGRYQEALKLLIDAYFERSGVPVITAHVYVDNVRSYKAHKNFGFMDYAMTDGAYGKQYVLIYKRK